MAQIFRKGDKVFDPLVGWGTVYNVVSYTEYPIVVGLYSCNLEITIVS